jgi:hypothetical protein
LWKYVKNVRRAEALGMEVARMGAVPVLVHTMYEHYQHLPESFWTEACRSILSTCHALAIDVPLGQYERSQGTVDEVRWAVEDDKPIFFDDDPQVPAGRVGPDGHTLWTVQASLYNEWLGSWVLRWTVARDRAEEEDAYQEHRIANLLIKNLERGGERR